MKKCKMISFANHKGGVGKTTTCLNVGGGLAKAGKRVLMIDLDPQANLTTGYGLYGSADKNVYDLLLKRSNTEETILNVSDNLDLIPSDLELSAAELELSSKLGREKILLKTLEPLKVTYDYILIDCPPSLGLLTTNALTACNEVFVPVQSEFYALHGLAKFVQVVDEIKSELNPDLIIGGVIVTRFDKRKVLNRDVFAGIKEYFGNKLMKTVIRENIALAESPSQGKNIFDYSKRSYGAKDYKALIKEIIKSGENNG